MSGHTRWSWVKMHDRYTIESMDETICHVGEESRARLIAASPTLLQAAKDALEYLEQTCPEDETLYWGSLRHAITKAEGK